MLHVLLKIHFAVPNEWPTVQGDREDGRRTWLYANSALILTTDSWTSTGIALLDFFSATLTRVVSAGTRDSGSS